jgi:hypothetical protein
MPHTSYGLFSGIRNHTLSSPTVRQSAELGVPNACNLCHLDQTLAWTQSHLSDWYGHSSSPLDADERTISAAVLWLLKGDAAQRAIAAWHFGWEPAQEVSGTEWMPPLIARLLEDPYGVVRRIAGVSLRKISGFEGIAFDFTGSPAELAAAVEAAQRVWESQPPLPHEGADRGAAVLHNENGGLDRARVEQVLSVRDDRPVRIKE